MYGTTNDLEQDPWRPFHVVNKLSMVGVSYKMEDFRSVVISIKCNGLVALWYGAVIQKKNA